MMDCDINGWNLSGDRFLEGLERLGITGIHFDIAKSAAERIINGRLDEFCRVLSWMFENEPSISRAQRWLDAWDIIRTAIRHWKREEAENKMDFITESENQLTLFDRRPQWALASKPRF